ncbi:hypothetical protein CLV01_3916 [Delftia sp. 60]|uniref:hypothetical protein n=1 Tax=Delftia sp. 60 TaxID=2035216 RepID=UPI000C19C430|nr:hypothetical protein [Delftia sp. 60]PIF37317.1 hypothetical protein CLU98_2534 [Burkholderiales bacterium 23]PIF67502.1 hypothetical protein CLV01_3916 [Delftia sp. 60]
MAQPQTPEPHSSEPATAASANGSDPAKPPTPPKPPKPPKSRIVPWLIGLPVAFFAVLMLAGQLLSTPEGEARWVERETIKICRKETARPEAERKTQQFESVQDCDRLEFDFKQRYGENP